MNLPFEISEEKQQEINNLKILPKGMSKFEVGDVYNHLTILGRAENAIGYRNTYVYAICDCSEHNIIRVQLNKLKNNNTISCGCEHKKAAARQGIKTGIDMIGTITGDFKVIEKTDERDSESIVWLCKCIYCGEVRKISQRNMKDNIRHPNVCSCQRRGGSSFERAIEKILNENKINYCREKTFENFLYEDTQRPPRFDFFLPDYNCLIEVHGKQHYVQGSGYMENENLEIRQQRDEFKINWAIKNGYTILVIPYTEINNITISDLLPITSKFKERRE